MIRASSNQMFAIGTKVISVDFGVGTVSAIVRFYPEGDDYYLIKCGSGRAKSYFPVKGNKKIRALSSRPAFEEALDLKRYNSTVKEFESRKSRQQYFERSLNMSDLLSIVLRISELELVSDLIPREQNIIDRLIATLELEARISFKMSKSESKEFVTSFLH